MKQSHCSVSNVNHVVIQDIFVSIDKKRIFSRRSNQYDRRWKLLNMHDVVMVKRQFSRVNANLANKSQHLY